jgi:hypothetical protein
VGGLDEQKSVFVIGGKIEREREGVGYQKGGCGVLVVG